MSYQSIGDIVSTLFPQGFAHNQYDYYFNHDNEASDEILKYLSSFIESPIFPEVPDAQSERLGRFRKSYDLKLTKLKNSYQLDEKKIFRKYWIPPYSPFDMFAIMSTLLLNSGAYHHFEPSFTSDLEENGEEFFPPKRIRIVKRADIQSWESEAQNWKNLADYSFQQEPRVSTDNPELISEYWLDILNHWDSPIFKIIPEESEQPTWWFSALSLLAISDGASRGVGFSPTADTTPWILISKSIIESFRQEEPGNWNVKATKTVESISIADRDHVNILPKTRTAQLGCTLRGLSFNLSKLPGRGRIRVSWSPVVIEPKLKKNPVFNMLLIPFPYEINSFNFKPTKINNEDGLRWGYFSTDIEENEDEDNRFIAFVENLLHVATLRLGEIHGIVLPELSISRSTANKIIQRISESKYAKSLELCCFGVREREKREGKIVAVNGALMGLFDEGNLTESHFHQKHHRWRLTEDQILMYDLSPALDPTRTWWEDIRLTNRSIPIVVLRNRWSATSLICEDLARNDPARQIVESIGPNLVISLLMDGPQLPQRWSARYATVLAEDPGSSVLSITSFGLINRSNRKAQEKDFDRSYSFALWKDDNGRSTQITLDKDSHAAVISLSEYPKSELTFDGRQNHDKTSLQLTAIRQIKSSNHTGYPKWSPRNVSHLNHE